MRLVVWKSRALAMGLVCAAAGFCYAVSTSPVDARTADARAVGSTFPLRFTNPLVGGGTSGLNEFDLGDACFGSTITRYVTAEGGLKPYRFTSAGSLGFDNVIAGFQTSLQFGISGLLAGSVPGRPLDPVTRLPLAFPSKIVTGEEGFRFEVTVRDAKGTNVETATGFFNLRLIDCDGIFRFANDSLPSARLAADYLTKVETVGGSGPFSFTLVTATTPGGTLEEIGLSLGTDGTLMGKPLATGTFILVVRCTDGRKAVAQGRAGTSQDQAFALVVNDNPITSSDLVTTQCFVRGDRAVAAKDSLKYRGIINVLGQDNFSLLNSDITFRLGNIGFSGRLDRKGQFATILADRSVVKVKINPMNGLIDISIKKGSFTRSLGFDKTPPVPGTTRRVVQISVGDAVNATEVLDFETDVSGVRYTLNYKLGQTGRNPAGAFQIVSVKGKDAITLSGQPGDAWKTKFLALPRSGVVDPLGRTQGLTSLDSVTVRIGTNFTQTMAGAVLRSSGVRASFKGTIADGVKTFTYDARKSTGQLQTNVLSSARTGIPTAISSPGFGTLFFPLGLDFTRTGNGAPFTGEHARRIFGLQNKYSDVPPRR